MIRLHCSTCDEQIEVRAEYIANFGFRLTIPTGWVLAIWPAQRQPVGCPHCVEVSTNMPEKIDEFPGPNLPPVENNMPEIETRLPAAPDSTYKAEGFTTVPDPSPEADDAVGARQAEEFRKRFVNRPYGGKR